MTENLDTTVEMKEVNSNNEAGTNDDPTLSQPITKNVSNFLPLLAVAQVFGLASILLLIYWANTYAGGFTLNSNKMFNWHPLLLTISLVYFTGNGILTFRAWRNLSKNKLKLIHAAIKGLVVILATLGTWAAFRYYRYYSLHSWIGFLTLILFATQTVLGLTAFMFPGFKPQIRNKLMPYHVFFGQTIFGLAIICVLSGINEKAIYKLKKNYSKQMEGTILNLIGTLSALFGVIIAYLASNHAYN